MSLALQETAAPKTSAPTGAPAGAKLYLVGFQKWGDMRLRLVSLIRSRLRLAQVIWPRATGLRTGHRV